MTKVVVDGAALQQVLEALVGPPHLIRELQATRNFPDNVINQLVLEFNEQVAKIEAGELSLAERLQRAREAELFEDGLSADLHEAGVDTVAAAYMQGRIDVLNEIEQNT